MGVGLDAGFLDLRKLSHAPAVEEEVGEAVRRPHPATSFLATSAKTSCSTLRAISIRPTSLGPAEDPGPHLRYSSSPREDLTRPPLDTPARDRGNGVRR